ncbi:MAG: hypothetical protein DRI69_00325 [Bacteroidetes bacterium]|nr:MAG: hypothetical protein DRI69_00325 [Bacteroidota bacterium]
MNLTKYTCLRFALYFIVFAVLILTCSKAWPGSFLGKWYTIVGIAAILTVIEFFVVNKNVNCSQCLKKKHLNDVRTRLKDLGYKLTDNKIDHLIFLKRVNLVRWEIARIAFKKNYMELELPENDVAYFNEWSVTRTDSEGACGGI